jgi:hypothetical protein
MAEAVRAARSWLGRVAAAGLCINPASPTPGIVDGGYLHGEQAARMLDLWEQAARHSASPN